MSVTCTCYESDCKMVSFYFLLFFCKNNGGILGPLVCKLIFFRICRQMRDKYVGMKNNYINNQQNMLTCNKIAIG